MPGNSKNRSLWVKIAIAELLVVIILYAASPYLVSKMGHNAGEESKRTEEVRKRLQALQAKEKAKRANTKLARHEVERLKKNKVDRAKRSLKKKVEDLLEVHRDMKKERQEREEMIAHRKKEDALAQQAEKLESLLEEMDKQSEVLKRHGSGNLQDKAADLSDALLNANKELMSGNAKALGEIIDVAQELKDNLAELRANQEAARGDPELLKNIGEPGHTAWMQEQLNQAFDQIENFDETLSDSFNDLSALPSPEDRPTSSLEDMDLQQLYDEAKGIEQAIQNDYQAARAMEMAKRDGSSLSQAAQQTAGQAPSRSEQDFAAMASGVATPKDMQNFSQQLSQAAGQVNDMLNAASTMLNQMNGGHASNALSAIKRSQVQRQLQNAVRGGAPKGANALNLSALMRQASGGGKSSGKQSAGAKSAVSMSSEGGGKGGTGKGAGGGEGGGGKGRNRGEGGKSMGSKADAKHKTIKIPTDLVQAEALPGRRFTQKSNRSGWLYLDTWYIIGPWENKGKINYQVTHPPEYEIDLSKVYGDGKKKYSGKARELAWTFTQGSSMKIIPPEECSNSTYYAWTEVYFDAGREMLLAIASDDAAKVWINDMLVWEDKGQSAWNLDEGFRQVYFKSGFNKVLVRIENGPILCTFSIVICPLDVGKG
ncbi:MAG: hypothetical protein HQL32_12205 [Planctomycetes bacterium]|nr:hypothetical protein [Planctomycetota bacterium]